MGYNASTQTIVPEGGISTHDVAKCLGVSSLDVGTLCINGNIKKWAKYKPVNFNKVGFKDFAEFAEACKTCKYGLYLKKNPASTNSSNYGSYGSISQMVADARAGILPTWEYDRPQGGINSPYRLADFSNYDNRAQAPIAGSRYPHPVIMSDNGTSFYYNFEFEITPEREDYHPLWLKLSDLYGASNQAINFGGMYFGAVMYNNSHYYVVTQSTPFGDNATIGEDLTGLTFNGALDNMDFAVDGSDWTFLPFFSTQPTGTLKDSDGATAFASSTKYPFDFAMYTQNIRRYKESSDAALAFNGFSVVIFTGSTAYRNKMYYSLSLTNNGGSPYTGRVVITINQTQGVLNKNLTLVDRTITIPAKSSYNSNTETQYPSGCMLIEVDMPAGASVEALIQAIEQNKQDEGSATATIIYGPESTRHTQDIVAINDVPTNP